MLYSESGGLYRYRLNETSLTWERDVLVASGYPNLYFYYCSDYAELGADSIIYDFSKGIPDYLVVFNTVQVSSNSTSMKWFVYNIETNKFVTTPTSYFTRDSDSRFNEYAGIIITDNYVITNAATSSDSYSASTSLTVYDHSLSSSGTISGIMYYGDFGGRQGNGSIFGRVAVLGDKIYFPMFYNAYQSAGKDAFILYQCEISSTSYASVSTLLSTKWDGGTSWTTSPGPYSVAFAVDNKLYIEAYENASTRTAIRCIIYDLQTQSELTHTTVGLSDGFAIRSGSILTHYNGAYYSIFNNVLYKIPDSDIGNIQKITTQSALNIISKNPGFTNVYKARVFKPNEKTAASLNMMFDFEKEEITNVCPFPVSSDIAYIDSIDGTIPGIIAIYRLGQRSSSAPYYRSYTGSGAYKLAKLFGKNIEING